MKRYDYADKTFLPLALLAAKTFLPLAVLISLSEAVYFRSLSCLWLECHLHRYYTSFILPALSIKLQTNVIVLSNLFYYISLPSFRQVKQLFFFHDFLQHFPRFIDI